MAGIPVLRSKLTIPQQTEAFIMTDRLKDICKSIFEQNIAILTAPAGYGKTSLLAAAVCMYRQNGCKVCWYRLDEQDKEPEIFYYHMMDMLSTSQESVAALKDKDLDGQEGAQLSHRNLNAAVINGLWNTPPRKKNAKIVIVFDDFQEVCGSENITLSLQYIIDNLPPEGLLIISSRTETDIVTVKQSLDKKVLRIDQEVLCFSEEELAVYVKDVCGIKTEPGVLHEMMKRTEGWAAGIAIMCRIFKKSGLCINLNQVRDKAADIMFFRYFTTEVLKKLEPGLLKFLAGLSVLKSFTVGEASCLADIADAHQLIELCEKNGLFIRKSTGEDFIYRFHGLFREVLQQLGQQYFSSLEREEGLIKAAEFDVENGSFNRAIETYITSGQILKAVDLMINSEGNLIAFELFEQLKICFGQLPEEMLEENATLMFMKTFTLQKGEPDIPELSKKALVRFKEDNNSFMQIKVYMMLAAYSQFRNDSRSAVKALKQAIDISRKDNSIPVEGFSLILTLLREVWEENNQSAARTCGQVNMLKLDGEWKWVTLLYSCMLHINTGNLEVAGCYIDEVLSLELIKKAEILKGFSLFYKALVCCFRGDRSLLTECRTNLMNIGRKHDVAFMLAFGHLLGAMECYREYNCEAAIIQLEESGVHFGQLGNTGMLGLTSMLQCLWRPRGEAALKPLTEAEKALEGIIHSKPGFNLEEIGHSLLGALYLEAGNYEAAREQLIPALEKCRSKKAAHVLCGVLLQLSRLYFNTGSITEGEEALRQAMQLAAENRYFILWDMHMQTVLEACSRAIKGDIFKKYAEEWLEALLGNDTSIPFMLGFGEVEEVYIPSYCSNFLMNFSYRVRSAAHKINIYLLGKFTVFVNGVAFAPGTWKTKKVEGIFKYLIINRGRQVPREVLMELFWPEADKQQASTSLRAALYELRKVLSRYGIAVNGKDSILNDKNGVLELATGSAITVDTDEFMLLYEKLGTLPKDEACKTARTAICEMLVCMYRGSFAEDFLLEDQVLFSREKYKSMFLEAAFSLTEQYIEDKRYDLAENIILKVLDNDTFNEKACSCLKSIYLATGRKSMAEKFFVAFKRRMVDQLGIMSEKALEE